MMLKSAATALTILISLQATADQPSLNESSQEELGFFTNGSGIVTLTNDHNDLPSSCVFKGRTSANRDVDDYAPIDSVTRMNWYITTSRKHGANYLLGNAHYESLWSYQCLEIAP